MKSLKTNITVRRSENTLASKTAWSMLGNSCNIGSRFGAQIIIARLMGPDALGRIAYMLWLVDLTLILFDLGLKNAVTRFISELQALGKQEEAQVLARLVYFRYLIMTILGSIGVVFMYLKSSASRGFEDVFPLLILLCLSRGLSTMFNAYLRGEQKFQLLARVNVWSGVCMITALGAGAYLFGFKGILGGYIVGPAIPAILLTFSILRAEKRSHKLDKHLNKRLWRFAINSWLIAVLGAVAWSRVEIFFIERYWDLSEVAMFTVGITLSGFAVLGPLMLTEAFMPHFTELFKTRDKQAVADAYASCTRLIAFVLFPISLGGAGTIPVLLPLLYGSAFTRAIPTAAILFAISAFTFAGVGNSLLYALERPGFKVLDGCIGAGLLIIGSLLIIPTWGAIGAASCRAGVQFCILILNLSYIRFWIDCPVPFGSLIRMSLSAGVCGLFTFGLLALWPTPAALGIAIPVAGVVYLFLCRRLHFLEEEDISRIEAFLAQVRIPFRSLICRMIVS